MLMHGTITSHSWLETLEPPRGEFIVHHPGITGEGSAEVVRGRPLLVGGPLAKCLWPGWPSEEG